MSETRKGVDWCDASSIATGFILEVGSGSGRCNVVQIKEGDYSNVNVVELGAALNGVNLALRWRLHIGDQ